MSMAATQHAVRAAGVGGTSTTTLALIGAGTFCLANPEKALQLLQRALLAISDGANSGTSSSSSNNHVGNAPTPIVIHAGNAGAAGGSSGTGKGLYYAVLQLSLGAGLCWGSYALLVNVLPEQAKNMLPVTQGTFKAAVTSLGKGLLHVKDTLSAELTALMQHQTELSHKQDETHEQVLYVQDQVADVHDDLSHMQNSLDDCHRALQTTDKRTTYIAKGIRLVTRGMTAMLPPDDELVQELRSFQKSDHNQGTQPNHSSLVNAPRHKPQEDGSRASASSRRSRRSQTERRSSRRAQQDQRRHQQQEQQQFVRNKPTTTESPYHEPCCSSDTLSVSTGTPVRAVVIPRHSKKNVDEISITSADPGLKELAEVHALLESMKSTRSAL